MTVSVVIPYRPGCPWRERAFDWTQQRWADWADVEVVWAPGPDGEFSRTGAIRDAVAACTGDVLIVADADVWVDGDAVDDAIGGALASGWAVPHRLIHRLSPESTEQVLAGANWRDLPLSTDNPQDSKPYVGHEAGTFLVITRAAFEAAPPDPRFVGWGQEDDAWASALRTIVGRPWRGEADLVHLWHPAEPRQSRRVGNDDNVALWRRYRAARGNRAAMATLIEEAA